MIYSLRFTIGLQICQCNRKSEIQNRKSHDRPDMLSIPIQMSNQAMLWVRLKICNVPYAVAAR